MEQAQRAAFLETTSLILIPILNLLPRAKAFQKHSRTSTQVAPTNNQQLNHGKHARHRDHEHAIIHAMHGAHRNSVEKKNTRPRTMWEISALISACLPSPRQRMEVVN